MTRQAQVLAFDVFGTVVDWHGSLVRELPVLAPQVDGNAFALAWRAGYQPAMQRVRSGELGWTRIDELHRIILDDLLPRFGLSHFDEAQRQHLNRAWHRLDPWPDTIPGLIRLKAKHFIAPLSNGNILLLANMAKRAGMPWDAILGAEAAQAYKPQPEAYLRTCEILGLQPAQVALVAAHNGDLAAARKSGLATAFVLRPNEHGADQATDTKAEQDWGAIATSFEDLADKLGC